MSCGVAVRAHRRILPVLMNVGAVACCDVKRNLPRVAFVLGVGIGLH